jgi:hypothetical protein
MCHWLASFEPITANLPLPGPPTCRGVTAVAVAIRRPS